MSALVRFVSRQRGRARDLIYGLQLLKSTISGTEKGLTNGLE
jgi:hypothetical protein